jgi:hypothetical protein
LPRHVALRQRLRIRRRGSCDNNDNNNDGNNNNNDLPYLPSNKRKRSNSSGAVNSSTVNDDDVDDDGTPVLNMASEAEKYKHIRLSDDYTQYVCKLCDPAKPRDTDWRNANNKISNIKQHVESKMHVDRWLEIEATNFVIRSAARTWPGRVR